MPLSPIGTKGLGGNTADMEPPLSPAQRIRRDQASRRGPPPLHTGTAHDAMDLISSPTSPSNRRDVQERLDMLGNPGSGSPGSAMGTKLDLSYLNLGRMPKATYRVENPHLIQTLNLAGNNLTFLPEAMRGLRGLVSLNLADNELETVPEWICELPQLRELDLTMNNLRSLPASVAFCNDDLELRVHEMGSNNEEVFQPPASVVANGIPAIRAFFQGKGVIHGSASSNNTQGRGAQSERAEAWRTVDWKVGAAVPTNDPFDCTIS